MSWKAYPPAWALHEAARAAAARWQRRGLLTPAQQTAIEAASPLDFYRPGIWLRITLFLFTCLAVAMAGGTLNLMVLSGLDAGSRTYFHLLTVLYLGGGSLLLELVIRNGRHYRSGVDNALLYTTLTAALTLLGLVFYDLTGDLDNLLHPKELLLLVGPALLIQLAAVRRYADPLVAITAYGTYLLLMVGLVLQLPAGMLLLPFGLMAASAAAYWALQRGVAPRADLLYYHSAYQTTRVLALVTFYLGGNYLVVREGHAELSHTASAEIALAGLFYALTAGIPLAYVAVALRRHDRPLLLTGLVLIGFSLFTYRYYHQLLPPAVAATLAGVALMAAAIALMRYLHPQRHGLTSADDDEPRHLDLEALVVAQQPPDLPTGPPPTDGFQGFGGGHMGGGGASATY